MKTNSTDIIMVLDRSGSMGSIKNSTIEGVNKFLTDQKAVPGECRITLVQFDHLYEPVLNGVPVQQAEHLNHATYQPRGNTALFGAIGRTIEQAGQRLAHMAESDRPEKVIFVIITDGEENDSQNNEWSKMWNQTNVREAVERQTNAYKWQFVYIGANQDAFLNASRIGIMRANTMNYAANPIGTDSLYTSMSANVRSFRVGKNAGGQSVSSMSWSDEDRELQKAAMKSKTP